MTSSLKTTTLLSGLAFAASTSLASYWYEYHNIDESHNDFTGHAIGMCFDRSAWGETYLDSGFQTNTMQWSAFTTSSGLSGQTLYEETYVWSEFSVDTSWSDSEGWACTLSQGHSGAYNLYWASKQS